MSGFAVVFPANLPATFDKGVLMIAEQISDAKRSLKATVGMVEWIAAAVIATGCALVMFTIALFIWLTQRYDALTASLILGAAFTALAFIFFLVVLYIRSRREQERRMIAARRAAQSPPWMEPAILAAGLDLARLIGGRRTASLAAGAVAALWLLNKTDSKSNSRRAS
jgi:uncharacterized membrane protein YbhN (UPF0104 family)